MCSTDAAALMRWKKANGCLSSSSVPLMHARLLVVAGGKEGGGPVIRLAGGEDGREGTTGLL